MSSAYMLCCIAASVALLVALTVKVRLHPFFALTLSALAFGLAVGLDVNAVMDAYAGGLGATIAGIGVVIAIGTVMGALMEKSGSAEKMAEEFYLSRPYLSARFKRETGLTLTDYILTEKTEEAKRLLRYSDKPAAAIGAYLGFSSHGHFIRVFKRYAGQTPNEYRAAQGR